MTFVILWVSFEAQALGLPHSLISKSPHPLFQIAYRLKSVASAELPSAGKRQFVTR